MVSWLPEPDEINRRYEVYSIGGVIMGNSSDEDEEIDIPNNGYQLLENTEAIGEDIGVYYPHVNDDEDSDNDVYSDNDDISTTSGSSQSPSVVLLNGEQQQQLVEVQNVAATKEPNDSMAQSVAPDGLSDTKKASNTTSKKEILFEDVEKQVAQLYSGHGHNDIEINSEKVLSAMAGFTLPPSAVPPWAAEVPESKWSEFLLNRIHSKK